MPEQLPFTHVLNELFAGPANALLNAIHHPAKYPEAPISNWLAMEILVAMILILIFIIVLLALPLGAVGAGLDPGLDLHRGSPGPTTGAVGAGLDPGLDVHRRFFASVSSGVHTPERRRRECCAKIE